MSNEPVIQVRYTDLHAIVGRLSKQRDASEVLAREIKMRYTPLREGSFRGEMATTFYAEMEDLIFPALAKLVALLGDMQVVTDDVARLFRMAEEEASRFSQNGAISQDSGGRTTDDQNEHGSALRGSFLGIPYSFSFYRGLHSTDKGAEQYIRGDFLGIPFSFKQRGWAEDPGFAPWKWDDDAKYTIAKSELELNYGHAEYVYKQFNGEAEFQFGPLKISDGLSAKLGAADGGLGVKFDKDMRVGAHGGTDGVKVENEMLFQVGGFGMTFKDIGRGLGVDADAGFDWEKKKIGAGVEARLVSVERQVGLNIDGTNYYISVEAGPKAGIGLLFNKGLKAKIPLVSLGFGFGDPVDGKVDD